MQIYVGYQVLCNTKMKILQRFFSAGGGQQEEGSKKYCSCAFIKLTTN